MIYISKIQPFGCRPNNFSIKRKQYLPEISYFSVIDTMVHNTATELHNIHNTTRARTPNFGILFIFTK